MKYLVTGANGFIGSSLVRNLAKQDKEVIAVVSPESTCWRIKDLEKITIVRRDLTKKKDVNNLLKKTSPNYIAHLATYGVYTYQQGQKDKIIEANWFMAVNMLTEATRLKNLKRFINFGSVYEYGSRYGKVKEEEVNIADILNEYSATKIATTSLAAAYYDKIPIVTIRPFTAYGPFEDKARFIVTTVLRGLRGENIRIAPGVIRDFIFVDDIAEAIARTFETKKAESHIINVGSGHKNTLNKVAEQVKDLTGNKSKIINDVSYKRKKDSRCWADISKAERLLGWKPKHSLRKGLMETIAWYKENGNKLP